MKLLELLKAIQSLTGMIDKDFADAIGIRRATWQTIRTGVRELGVDSLSAISRHIPELQPEVQIYLRGDPLSIVQCVATRLKMERAETGTPAPSPQEKPEGSNGEA